MTWDEAASFPSHTPASCVYFDPMTCCGCLVVWRWEQGRVQGMRPHFPMISRCGTELTLVFFAAGLWLGAAARGQSDLVIMVSGCSMPVPALQKGA